MEQAGAPQEREDPVSAAREGAPADRLGYVPVIDGLRAIAVLAVLAFHVDRPLLPGGFAGVDIFFVISGFVVTASMIERPSRGFRDLFVTFYARRIVRIVPALLVCLLVTFLLMTVLVPTQAPDVLHVGLAAFAGVSNLALILIRPDYFSPSAALDPFVHTWSLGVEEQFYLLFPLILWLLRREPRTRDRLPMTTLAAVAAAGALSFLLYAGLGTLDRALAFYLMPARFWELATGVLLFLTVPAWLPRLRRLGTGIATGLWIVSVAAIAWFFVRLPVAHYHIPSLVLPTGGALLLIALGCARRGDVPARLLGGRPFVLVGLASYSLYLWHWPMLVLAGWTYGLDTPLKIGSTILLILVAATLSYLYVERPTRGAFRSGRIGRTNVMIAGPAALLAGAAAAFTLFQIQPALSLAVPPSRLASVKPRGCTALFSQRAFHQGIADEWRPCRIKAERLFVIGDSHALVYRPLLDRYATEAGGPVRRYYRERCTFPPVHGRGAALGACLEFDRAAVAAIAREARAGDAIFMTSRRLRDAFEPSPTDAERMAGARATARLLPALAATGATIIIEAPKPVFRSAASRCIAWFNRMNPACRGGLTTSRPFLLAKRRPELQELQQLAASIPGARIWDPFPILCPSDPCRALDGDKLLYWDDNHIAAPASARLWPSFRNVLARRPAAPAGASASPIL